MLDAGELFLVLRSVACSNALRRSGWKTKSVERFGGPFVGNTSFPLLIIGNTADPVTPLTQYAVASSSLFMH